MAAMTSNPSDRFPGDDSFDRSLLAVAGEPRNAGRPWPSFHAGYGRNNIADVCRCWIPSHDDFPVRDSCCNQ